MVPEVQWPQDWGCCPIHMHPAVMYHYCDSLFPPPYARWLRPHLHGVQMLPAVTGLRKSSSEHWHRAEALSCPTHPCLLLNSWYNNYLKLQWEPFHHRLQRLVLFSHLINTFALYLFLILMLGSTQDFSLLFDFHFLLSESSLYCKWTWTFFIFSLSKKFVLLDFYFHFWCKCTSLLISTLYYSHCCCSIGSYRINDLHKTWQIIRGSSKWDASALGYIKMFSEEASMSNSQAENFQVLSFIVAMALHQRHLAGPGLPHCTRGQAILSHLPLTNHFSDGLVICIICIIYQLI